MSESVSKRTYNLKVVELMDAKERIAALEAENAELQQDAKALAESLSEAGWTVLSWAAYAGDYFQEKHDLDGDLKAIGKIVSEHGAKYLTAQEGD